MNASCRRWIFSFSAAAVFACGAPRAWGQEQLVRHGDFRHTGSTAIPAEWHVVTPAVAAAACPVRVSDQGLVMDSPKEPFCVGGVWQDIKGVAGAKAYAVEVACCAEKVPDPYRAITVRLTWLARGKPIHPAGMYVRGPITEAGALAFRDAFVAPKEADGAKLALECKWLEGGRVLWQRASMTPTAPPPPRKVRVGTVYLRPRNSTPEQNLKLFCDQLDAAGRLKLDVVCLSEAITMVGTGKNAAQVAEPIPGRSTGQIGEAARRNRLWVVAGLYEQEGQRVYNTAVLVDREGRVAGKYRKTHLPREEWQQGVTPGSEYPVFKTDFGTVAIQICYDWFFPEVDSVFGLAGAEIVFAPTWGTTFADKEGRAEGETVFRVRARDNGIYLVPSVYDGQSMVIDPLGRILAANRGKEGVFWHEVDLSEREALWWVGHWRSIGPRDRMPPTYGPLLRGPSGPTR